MSNSLPQTTEKKQAKRLRFIQRAYLFAMASLFTVPAFADTGDGFLAAVQDFATSPLILGLCIVGMLASVVIALFGNTKLAMNTLAMVALAALTPWLVVTVFNLFKAVA